ncbi:hypothetical protein L210DRAFT_1058351 [Boletus edulis BED1]|uniref:Uncharacterized protein n=1 Tax=Boletus edulis BED1 TaxID=1328754 RepID=A0AAD4BCI3_BOLED|nr:hypothetical protein L210DRAFT_1058351 [Boletus edulis BED1]
MTYIARSPDGQLIASSSNYVKVVQTWRTATHVITGGEDHTVYIGPVRDNVERIDEAESQSTTALPSKTATAPKSTTVSRGRTESQ